MKFQFKIFIFSIFFFFNLATANSQTSLTPSASFLGTYMDERVGYFLHTAGDMNGDGFDDFLIGTFHNCAKGHNTGAAYLILGKSSPDWGFGKSLMEADARFIGREPLTMLPATISAAMAT